MGERIHSVIVRNEGKAEVMGRPITSHGTKFAMKSKVHVSTPFSFSFFVIVPCKLKKKVKSFFDASSSFCG